MLQTVTTPTDRDLLAAFVQAGDEAAFSMLFERHARPIYRFCRRMLLDDADALDATQAVFIALSLRARRVRRQDSIAPWLFHVARCICSNLQRDKRRRQQRERIASVAATTAGSTQPSHQDTSSVINDELSRLPEKYRAALVLFHLEGHSLADTAAALGCGAGTAGSLLSRGRECLRRRLERRGVIIAAAALASLLSAASESADIRNTDVPLARDAASPGPAAFDPHNARAREIAKGVLLTMALTKTRNVLAPMLSTLLLALSIGWACTAHSEEIPPVAVEKPAAKTAAADATEAKKDPAPQPAPATRIVLSDNAKKLSQTYGISEEVLLKMIKNGAAVDHEVNGRAVHTEAGDVQIDSGTPVLRLAVPGADRDKMRDLQQQSARIMLRIEQYKKDFAATENLPAGERALKQAGLYQTFKTELAELKKNTSTLPAPATEEQKQVYAEFQKKVQEFTDRKDAESKPESPATTPPQQDF